MSEKRMTEEGNEEITITSGDVVRFFRQLFISTVQRSRGFLEPVFASSIARLKGYFKKYHWVLNPLIVFLLSRTLVFGAAHVGNVFFPTDPGHWMPDDVHPFMSLWVRWDSQWYSWIVEQGYWMRPGLMSNVAFFPLYPLSVSFLNALLGGHKVILSGVLVSHAAFFGALVYLYLLTDLEFNNRKIARRAIFYLAIFPSSFYFSAMYTESMFMLFSVATLYYARRHEWGWAALMGILTSATRIIGIIAWGLVMWEWLRAHGWTLATIRERSAWENLWAGIKKDWAQLLVIALIPLGILSYMGFLYINFHDPVAFFTAQSAWNRENIGPWAVVARDLKVILAEGLNQSNTSLLLNIFSLLWGTTLGVVAWRRLGDGYGIYVLLSLMVPAASSSISIIRFTLVCFPIFMVLGDWGARNTSLDRLITAAFGVLLGVLTAAHVNWIFVA